jgi:thioredoxin-related protein
MKFTSISALRLSMSILCAFALACTAFASGIEWKGYEAGLDAAKSGGKPSLVCFSTGWCGVCKKMDKEVLSDSDVVGKLNSGFVSIKVDGEERKDLAGKYRIFSYPTYIILDKDGGPVHTTFGYTKKEDFIAMLDYATTGSCENMSFKEYQNTL